jgi:hypothetical protein
VHRDYEPLLEAGERKLQGLPALWIRSDSRNVMENCLTEIPPVWAYNPISEQKHTHNEDGLGQVKLMMSSSFMARPAAIAPADLSAARAPFAFSIHCSWSFANAGVRGL